MVLQEIVEVFEEIQGLPPKRYIYLYIYLMLGDETELKEMKMKLEELLNKGYICPSVSPWVELILFVKKKDETLRLCIDFR